MRNMRRLVVASIALASSAPSIASAAMSVTITDPTAGAIEGASVHVVASVTSDYQVTTLRAQVQSTSIDLKTTSDLPLASVPIGPQSLTVTATDAVGNTASSTVQFIHDTAPTLTVNAPLEGTVARPNVSLDVQCSDGDTYGCASIDVYATSPTDACPAKNPGPAIASGGATLQQALSLASSQGKELGLCIVAKDTAGATTGKRVDVYVDASGRLIDVTDVKGPIVQVDATRILYAADGALYVHDRGAGSDALVAQGASVGALIEGGVAYLGADGHAHARTAQDVDLGAATALSARGRFVAWIGPTSSATTYDAPCMLRDLNAAASVQMNPASTSTYSNDCVGPIAVDGAGRAIFYVVEGGSTTTHAVWRYENGSAASYVTCPSTQGCGGFLTDDASFALSTFAPDVGVDAVYLAPAGAAPITLTSAFEQPAYALSSGWTAFPKRVTAAPAYDEIWRRAPDGTTTQVSFFTTQSTVDAIDPSGDVLYFHEGARLLAAAGGGAAPETISTALGRGIAIGGAWYVTIGRSLFRVDPNADLDAGAAPVDAASPDATIDGSNGAVDGGADAGGVVDGGGGALDDAETNPGVAQDASASGPSNGSGGASNDSSCSFTAAHDGESARLAPLAAIALLGAWRVRRRRARR